VLLALPGQVTAAGPAPDTTETNKYWLLLTDRPGTDATGTDAWTEPVAPAYLRRLRRHGVDPVVRSRWLHAVSARLTPGQRRWARSCSFVRTVRPVAVGRTTAPAEPPRPLQPSLSPTPPPPDRLRLGQSRGPLTRINAVAPVERGLNGHGVRIGFLDAHYRGLRHEAFNPLRREGRMVALRNFAEGRQSGNHGMGVASVTVGQSRGTLVGPAHGAEVLGASTEYVPFERNVEEDYFVAGLEWLQRRGADVVNVSIGYTTFDEGQDDYSPDDLDGDTGLTTRAVDRAAQLGLTVVVSAGNSGCADPDSCWYYVNTPADADSAITVGAIGPDSTLASFSSRGPTADGRIKPDVVVQGKNVVAAWKNSYAQVGGTSFASPQVTAVVAQMLQVNPDLSPIEVRTLLRQTASQADNPDNRMGWGIVNADAALQAAERRARAHPPRFLQVDAPYPSPASTRLTIPVRAPDDIRRLTLALRTPMGRTVTEKVYHVRPGPNWLTVDVKSLPPGLYWYRLESPHRSEAGTISLLR
jgi:serine protease AprX